MVVSSGLSEGVISRLKPPSAPVLPADGDLAFSKAWKRMGVGFNPPDKRLQLLSLVAGVVILDGVGQGGRIVCYKSQFSKVVIFGVKNRCF